MTQQLVLWTLQESATREISQQVFPWERVNLTGFITGKACTHPQGQTHPMLDITVHSCFSVSSPVHTLHTTITPVITVLEQWSLTSRHAIGIHMRFRHSNALIMWVIAVCKVQTGIEILKQLHKQTNTWTDFTPIFRYHKGTHTCTHTHTHTHTHCPPSE